MDSNCILSPVTLGKDVYKLFSLDLSYLKQAYWSLLGIDISRYLTPSLEISLFCCKKTGYRFFYPECCGDDSFYQELQFYPWYYQENKWEFEVALKNISTGKLLEIGCGQGHFLKKLKIENVGIELNQDAVHHCLKNNLNVINENFDQYSGNNIEEFDYIVSFQVLEHFFDISSYFISCFRSLKKGGKLIIGVPNTNSLIFKPYSSYYYKHGSLLLNLPPHHIGWWTAKSLVNTANYFGFTKKQIYFEKMPDQRLELVKTNLSIRNNFLLSKRFENYLINKFRKILPGETMVGVFVKN
jgi:SAM-dependent methyltransferase